MELTLLSSLDIEKECEAGGGKKAREFVLTVCAQRSSLSCSAPIVLSLQAVLGPKEIQPSTPWAKVPKVDAAVLDYIIDVHEEK